MVVGRELAYRLYTEEGLQLRSKRPRRRNMAISRRERYVPKRANQAWSMDFVADQLSDGTRLRALTVVDVFAREAPCIRAGVRLRAEHVVEACNEPLAKRGAPIRVSWTTGVSSPARCSIYGAYHHGVQIDFSRPGKPTDNCFVESFNGSFRDECLTCIDSMQDAKEKIEAWRTDYNESRPHQLSRI